MYHTWARSHFKLTLAAQIDSSVSLPRQICDLTRTTRSAIQSPRNFLRRKSYLTRTATSRIQSPTTLPRQAGDLARTSAPGLKANWLKLHSEACEVCQHETQSRVDEHFSGLRLNLRTRMSQMAKETTCYIHQYNYDYDD